MDQRAAECAADVAGGAQDEGVVQLGEHTYDNLLGDALSPDCNRVFIGHEGAVFRAECYITGSWSREWSDSPFAGKYVPKDLKAMEMRMKAVAV